MISICFFPTRIFLNILNNVTKETVERTTYYAEKETPTTMQKLGGDSSTRHGNGLERDNGLEATPVQL